jgi:uncharacterized protein YneF (UPF0154 family)
MLKWLFNGLGTTVVGILLGAFLAGKLIKIKIPYVDYFNKWQTNKFIKTYLSLCQFHEFGRYKWPPANFSAIAPFNWFNDMQYTIAGNRMFEGTGTHIFSEIKQSFLVKEFIDKNGQKQSNKKMSKILRFWNNRQTWFDKITNSIIGNTQEKQQVLVLYQSDDNYDRILDSSQNKTISYTGEHSLLFVFYLTDKTQVFRINNAEITEQDVNSADNKVTYFYLHRTKLDSL